MSDKKACLNPLLAPLSFFDCIPDKTKSTNKLNLYFKGCGKNGFVTACQLAVDSALIWGVCAFQPAFHCSFVGLGEFVIAQSLQRCV
ncbi:hypothetical protein TNIN_71771 [Trichonephila inaurata madagascariensis]|uniref:Uncharacterized protein n=1 Tax=Trichonephila inaurata madagascariensis TaxID=2747483 RepID=A0A8X6X7S0_9ARAC|nr:hypothetical protein TNIN_71771 [Trichonephila inaurata madagascariensis]